jgi:hypothetical protein
MYAIVIPPIGAMADHVCEIDELGECLLTNKPPPGRTVRQNGNRGLNIVRLHGNAGRIVSPDRIQLVPKNGLNAFRLKFARRQMSGDLIREQSYGNPLLGPSIGIIQDGRLTFFHAWHLTVAVIERQSIEPFAAVTIFGPVRTGRDWESGRRAICRRFEWR